MIIIHLLLMTQVYAEIPNLKLRKECFDQKIQSSCDKLKNQNKDQPKISQKPPAKTKFTLARAKALSYAADLPETLSTAKMEAMPKGRGYRFVTIDKDSVFATLGFQPQDVLTHVNDEAITSSAQATALLPKLAFESEFKVRLLRDNKALIFNYELVD